MPPTESSSPTSGRGPQAAGSAGAWLAAGAALAGGAAALALGAGSAPVTWLGAGLALLGGALAGHQLAHRRFTAAVRQAVDRTLTDAGPLLPASAGLVAGPVLPAATLPELQPLVDGLQRVLDRQRALFEAQAQQLETLRQQAHSDPLTGLSNRRHFLATLDAMLAHLGGEPGAGLLLLRLRDLQGMNQRIGHAATDSVLQAVAKALQAYPARIERCCAGRLNGADFALLLPVGGVAGETVASLVEALRPSIQRIDAQAGVAAGAVELQGAMRAAQALALADAALARAEAEGGAVMLPLQASDRPDDATLALGEAAWQRRIGRALVQGRVALGEFPVQSADGRVLLLDCPMRLQLDAGGPMEPAARWLSLAVRSRLSPAVDEKAVALALHAIALDGQARCVNVAAPSAMSAEFIAAVARRLEAAPAQACRLWIDLPEALALERPMLVRELSRRWRPLGVMLGLEHAGEGLARIPRLIDLGLDCVRIDSRFVNGIADAGSDDARRYLQGLVRLVQSVGLQVSAEGVRSPDDLERLWALGFDAATGPALSAALMDVA